MTYLVVAGNVVAWLSSVTSEVVVAPALNNIIQDMSRVR